MSQGSVLPAATQNQVWLNGLQLHCVLPDPTFRTMASAEIHHQSHMHK